jgi:acetyl-CoA carboxylase biotin carboxyl carrier protein
MSSRKEQLAENSVTRQGRSRASVESGDQPAASVNMDELRELIALLRENGLAELELELESFRVRLRREGVTSSPDFSETVPTTGPLVSTKPAVHQTPSITAGSPVHPGAHAETAASGDQDLHIISSPIVGTFYRSPSPNADPFVKIGSNVESETVVCIIEAMKLMNEIQAEVSGEVAKVYVENGQPVEYGQPLFGIKS